MDRRLNDLALDMAANRIEQARNLVAQTFYRNTASDRPDISEVLICAQLLATEYNSLVMEQSAASSTESLKSYLHNDF